VAPAAGAQGKADVESIRPLPRNPDVAREAVRLRPRLTQPVLI